MLLRETAYSDRREPLIACEYEAEDILTNRKLRMLAALVASLAAAYAGFATVLAHGSPPLKPVNGIVTSIGSGSMQLLTAGGSVSVSLNSSTRVTRLVAGSNADLVANARVEVHFAAGTTTVDSIRIEAGRGAGGSVRTSPTKHSLRPTPRPVSTRTAKRSATPGTHLHPPTPNRRNETDGQIVKVTATSISVRGDRGQSSTYNFGSNVSVTKVMPGKVSDIATGERVLALLGSSNLALWVTITNS